MNWYVAYTRALQEFNAYRNLYHSKISVFLPTVKRLSIKRNRRIVISDPLFPSYLFLSFSTDGEWNKISNCKEIEYIYENNGIPSPIPEREINKFLEADKAGLFDLTKPKAQFQEGESVEITEGPFAGFIAKVRSASPSKRVKLLLSLLGGSVTTSADACNLRRVG